MIRYTFACDLCEAAVEREQSRYPRGWSVWKGEDGKPRLACQAHDDHDTLTPRQTGEVHRELVKDVLKRHPKASDRLVAAMVTGDGWQLSARSVGRARRVLGIAPKQEREIVVLRARSDPG